MSRQSWRLPIVWNEVSLVLNYILAKPVWGLSAGLVGRTHAEEEGRVNN